MSDTAAADLARKRSRSSSPDPSVSKKPNTDQQGKLTLQVDEHGDQPHPTTTEDPSITNEIDNPNGNTDPKPDLSEAGAAPAPMQTDDSSSAAGAVPANTTTTTTTTEGAAPMAVDPSSSSDPSAQQQAPGAADQSGTDGNPAAQQIQMRALIVTQDASIIIGKGGKNVNEIREKSGSKVNISESVPGNPERVMVIAGQLDAVSKAFGLIVRRINDEPFDVPSVPGSRAVTIRFIIPNSRMGSVIGKGGSKIKEIQEASGARLQASETLLPGSTERVLSVSGVADAIHIAVYYIGTILQEHPPTTGTGSGSSSNTSYAPSGGRSSSYQSDSRRDGGPPRAYGSGAAPPPLNAPQQQIYIPNELVGSIIGKAGSKINEIRSQSQCQIRISEPGENAPGANPSERLVTIIGQPNNIQVAVRLLYDRLEKERAKMTGM